MTAMSVADLPVGSVIANDHTAWIKCSAEMWLGTGDGMSTYDWEPQEALNGGAVVLRRGLDGLTP